MINCPVCRTSSPHAFMTVKDQEYWRCKTCEATFLDPSHRLGRGAEKAIYDQHENDVADPGYRKFLSKLTAPLLEKLTPGSKGLDYGCGPGPALAEMLREKGHFMALYDPFFYSDKMPLNVVYDFITCTETIEHFHNPAEEFDKLNSLLRPGGILALMTCFQADDSKFATWHYRNDPTHVVFYREKTFEVIAEQRGWKMEVPGKDVVLCFASCDGRKT